MNRPRTRTAPLLPALLIAALAAPAARSAEPIEVENLRVGFNETAKVGAWTPIWLTLKANEAFQGRVIVTVPDDDDSETAVSKELTLPAGATQTVALSFRCGAPGAEIGVRFVDAKGARLRIDYPRDTLDNVRWMTTNQVQVVSVGNPQGIADILKQPGQGDIRPSADNPDMIDHSVIVSAARLPGGLPREWLGYDSVDALVLDTNNAEAMEEWRASAGAIEDWVARGGHLVICAGAEQRVIRDDATLAGMTPATPVETTFSTDLGTLETWVGSVQPIVPTGTQVQIVKLEPVPGRGVVQDRLVVRGAFGFGRVTIVGLNVDRQPFAGWADRGAFWGRVLDLRRAKIPGAAGGPNNAAFRQDYATDLSTVLHRALDQFPGVKLVPFGWVAFFIFLYILLIGPGDYFFLKKVVKRMEFTWITFPLIVAAVSMLAYFAAYAMKGTEMRINRADVLDLDQASGRLRGTAIIDIFSPVNEDYEADLAPLPVDPPAGEAAAEPPPPKSSAEVILSWFGVSESRFGGMNNPNRRLSFSSNSYKYPPGRADRLEGLRIAMWSSKSLYARWFGSTGDKLIDAPELASDEYGQLRGAISNASGRTLRSPVLFYKDKVYELKGDLAPGQSVETSTLTSVRTLGNYVNSVAQQFDSSSLPNEVDARRRLLIALMFHRGVSDKNRELDNGPLRPLDLSSLLHLERAQLVAEVDGPAAELALKPDRGKPAQQGTTLVRVLLPLAPPKAKAEGR
jgi:hypothetical protein